MTVTHILKCWPAYYDSVESGEKTFELRFDDRGFQRGDRLLLCRTREDNFEEIEMDQPKGADGFYPPDAQPLHSLRCRISYVLHGPKFGLIAGHCIMALAPVEEEN